jgi:hypothetical protein
MRTVLFFLMFLSFSAAAQEPKVSFELASGVVIPFTGHWETAQFNVEANRIRLMFGFDYARYDKVNIQYLEARKYAAWLNNGFAGVGYVMQKGRVEITPSASLFAGAGFIKMHIDNDLILCSGCSENQPPAAFYVWRITRGFRFGLQTSYMFTPRLRAGVAGVFYPFLLADFEYSGRMAGAVQVSAALTLWRERERQ